MLRRLLPGLALLCLSCPTLLPARGAGASRPLAVLFLGDEGHHRPADRAEQLIPVLGSRGIDVRYTGKVSDLNPETLGKYDALIIYANTDKITPEQEKALVGYVEGGGGFVPLHCASYCFLNSPAYVKLVGAQFQKHGTGTFDTKVVDADHPIMKGVEPFRTWDETYVHTKVGDDLHLLQTRAEGSREEPWTWVREQGKGRVFYTAYGHDERTWGHPGFHDLVERGIRWAAHEGEVFDSRPRVAAGLEPFRYEEAKDRIPNYLPGEKWGTQGEAIRRMQEPASPSESKKHLALPKGFEAELFAAEPDIARPICMAFDHRGRLWVAESIDYPNQLKPKGQGRDRIKICEDTDGDGKADKFTIFAENLSIPTSLAFAGGGLVVHQAPDTLLLQDTDGDDKADVRKVLFTGWNTSDTHAGPSNLRYGLDNWLYGIVGYAGFRGTVGGESHEFRQGFYRFRPDGSKMEFLRNTNNNSWGVGFSEEGLLFGSTANGCPSVFAPIPNRYYENVRGWSAGVLGNIADTNRFFPATEKVRQVDWHGGFTAGAGSALYTARAYPKVYWNRTAFVSEPTGHLVATFTLHDHGADFTSHNAWNLAASDDEWTSPIIAEVGPDGQVWMVDWYNYIVQHNPTPQGFKTGKGGAYETTLRDKTHGRIYRIVNRSGDASPAPKLDPADPKSLVAALKGDNMLWRTHAQRLLVERNKKDVVPDLNKLVLDRSVDAIGLNPAAIHALWTLHGLGALDGEDSPAVAALGHPSAGVRRNAVLALARKEDAADAILSAKLLSDDDAQVRAAALLTLSELPPSEKVAEALVQALRDGRVDEGKSLGDALIVAAAAHDRFFLKALAASRFDRPAGPLTLAVAGRVAEHFARGVPADAKGSPLSDLADADGLVAEAVIAGLSKGWPKDRPAKFDDADDKAIVALLTRVSPEAKGQLIALATRMGSKGLEKASAEIARAFLGTVRDASKPDKERIDAARQLIELRKSNAEVAGELLAEINPRTSPALATGLVEAIGLSDAPAVGEALAAAVPALTPAVRPSALRVLLGKAEWTAFLLEGAEKGEISLAQLTLDQKQSLAAHPEKALAARARKLLAGGGGLPDADRQKVIDEISPVALAGGDAVKGKVLFKEQCAKCHSHGGEGGKVGPDLTGMAAHPKDELLIHILDPSRSVEGNFIQYNLATTDGRVLNGLLASENKNAVELLDAEGKTQVVLREDIDALVASKKSLMPEGFEKQVQPEGIANLLEFLTKRGNFLPLDLSKVATIASTGGMFYDKDSAAESLVFDDYEPKTFEGIPFHLVDPKGGRRPNAIFLHGPIGAVPPTMPKSVSLPCNASAKAIHLLSGVSGWGATDDKAPQTVSMIVRLHYDDGKTEDHPLRNGVEFADYIRVIDVPGSKLAFKLDGKQLRYLAVRPKRTEKIREIEFVKGKDQTAPIVMAVTVEGGE